MPAQYIYNNLVIENKQQNTFFYLTTGEPEGKGNERRILFMISLHERYEVCPEIKQYSHPLIYYSKFNEDHVFDAN